jgi:2-(1,2-epoxy-1,2-dihydrophenyl)acetyl-CoA isomerase
LTDQSILFSVDNRVAIIRLNRPEKLNALTPALLSELLSFLDEASSSKAHSIVLTGSGRAFSAGADLTGEGLIDGDAGKTLEAAYHPVVRRLAAIDLPIVSAINGPAVGAGAAIALMADISVMARSAYLQFGFVNIGLVPDAGTSWLLARSVGRTRALELALLGEPVDAERAHAMGLVTRIADDEQCFTQAAALARHLAHAPAMAVGMIRRQIAAALDMGHEQVLALEAENQSRAGATEDFHEGLAAFREKRLAVFKRR